ncbi:unnamed protein product [Symbiodinium sp. CCMP2592]|nr:unnamed protein product [Symbiodinium sp. CCMP2592]
MAMDGTCGATSRPGNASWWSEWWKLWVKISTMDPSVDSGEEGPREDDPSPPWFLRVAMKFLLMFVKGGIEYCGILCVSIGLAAKWVYWLMAGMVLVALAQLAYWTYVWVLTHHGRTPFRLVWCGPTGQVAWTAQYIQDKVRGRGTCQAPFDLLVTDGTALARLRHGTIRGRTNRHGFTCPCDTVHGSSHRYWRHSLEGANCRVHLCSQSPCTAPEAAEVHVTSSSVVPREVELDLTELAGKGPFGRCLTATWLLSAQGYYLWKSLGGCVCSFRRRCCQFCGCGSRPRRGPRPGGENGPEPSRLLHDWSETESEGDDNAQACQADQLAWEEGGKTQALCKEPCKDLALGKKTAFVMLGYAPGMPPYTGMHASARRKCAVEGCVELSRTTKGGVRLCKLHGAKEERKPPTSSQSKRTSEPDKHTPRRGSTPGGTCASADAPVTSRTCQIPRHACERFALRLGPDALGKLVRNVALGQPAAKAYAAACQEYGLDPHARPLQWAAREYLPRLPIQYPRLARKVLEEIAEQGQPQEHDPVLGAFHAYLQGTEGSGGTEFSPGAPPFVSGEPRHPALTLFGGTEPPAARSEPGIPVPPIEAGQNAPPAERTPFAAASLFRPREEGPGSHGLDESAKALQAIARSLVKDDQGQEKGKLSAIGRQEERLIFLLRGCDSLDVPLAAGVVGKELYHSLRAAATQARPKLRQLRFPVNLTNRLCYALASASFGAKDVKSLPLHCGSAADFPQTEEAEFDAYSSPPDLKLEPRPRGPTTVSTWLRNALRQAWGLACVYGQQHYAVWEAAALHLTKLGEEHSYAWPAHVIFDVWEELWARFFEELREVDRDLRRLMREESPTFDRMKFVATDPREYFTTDVLDRLALRGPARAGLPGGGGRAGDSSADGQAGHPGKPDEPPTRAGGAAGKGGGPPPALVGPGLSPKETARALEHRPRDADGHFQCWDFFTHRGCKKTDCSLSHKGSVKWKALDYSIKLQLLRRGGLRSTAKRSTDELVKEMTSLRSLEAQDQAAKIQEGGGRRRPGRKANRAGEVAGATPSKPPPDPTPGTRAGELDAEPQLPEARFEPGKHSVPPPPEPPIELRDGGYTLQEEGLRKLVQGYEFAGLDLTTRTSAMRAVEALLASQDPPLSEMPVATTLGGPELASQATEYLESTQRLSRACGSDQLGRGIGYGTFEYNGAHWRQFDYQDRLPLSPDMQALLGRNETLHVAAGVLSTEGELPTLAAAQLLGQAAREAMNHSAREVEAQLGPPPEYLTRAEADFRVFNHDLLHFGHDRDYRTLVAYPQPAWEHLTFGVWRVEPHGSALVEYLVGSRSGPDGPVVWLLVHKGHMRLLLPPASAAYPFGRELLMVGWEPHLEAAKPAEACLPARRVLACPVCRSDAPERAFHSGFVPPTFGLQPLRRGGVSPAACFKPGAPVALHRFTPSDLEHLFGCASLAGHSAVVVGCPGPVNDGVAIGDPSWAFAAEPRARAALLQLLDSFEGDRVLLWVGPELVMPAGPLHAFLEFLGVLQAHVEARGQAGALAGPVTHRLWTHKTFVLLSCERAWDRARVDSCALPPGGAAVCRGWCGVGRPVPGLVFPAFVGVPTPILATAALLAFPLGPQASSSLEGDGGGGAGLYSKVPGTETRTSFELWPEGCPYDPAKFAGRFEPGIDSSDLAGAASAALTPQRVGACSLPWESHCWALVAAWLEAENSRLSMSNRRAGGRPRDRSRERTPREAGQRSRLYDDGKKLTAFLRHTAPVDVNGYIAVEELLRFRRFEGWTSVRVREAVAASNKNRFNVRTSQGVEQVAAWSGHTIRGVLGPAQHVAAGSLPGVLVHGTYSAHVPSIQAEGIILIDACKAQAENHVAFRLTGNGIYLADHVLPSELFRYPPLEGVRGELGSREAAVAADQEDAAEAIEVSEDEASLPLNTETVAPGPVESLAAVAKALGPVAAGQEPATIFVKPSTFEILQPAGDDEEASPRRASRPEAASSSGTRAASVSRAGEVSGPTKRTATRTRSESPKVRFGTAHLQLIREIAQADSANFKSLKRVVEGSNVSAVTKSQTLDRLEQLAYQRGVASLEGKIRTLDVQRDVAQRARTESEYLQSLTPKNRALEQSNPEPKTSDARMQQAIAAGGAVWVERRKQKGRERAARHREAQVAQAAEERAAATSVIAGLPVDQRGPALDAEMDRRAREELTEFRRMLREEARAARPPDNRPRQKDSKRRAALKWQRWRQRRSTDDKERDTNHAIAHLTGRGPLSWEEASPAPAARFAPAEDQIRRASRQDDRNADARNRGPATERGDLRPSCRAGADGGSPGFGQKEPPAFRVT